MTLVDWLTANQYQINAGSGIFLALGLTGMSLLMILIWPNTLLKRLTLWFVIWLNAVMWRWIAAVLKPDLFGIKESLVAPGIFLVAGISTFALMIYAWVEYVRDGRR